MANQPRTKFVRIMETILIFLAIGVVTYGFLSLTNWNLHLKEWTGFSRFILGAEGLIFLIKIFDEL